MSGVLSTNFDEIEEWVKNGRKDSSVVHRRRLGKIGAKCAMPGCNENNNPLTGCWNENEVCDGNEMCLLGNFDDLMPKAQCKNYLTSACAPISSAQRGDVYQDYVYQENDPTTLPGGTPGPACIFPFSYNGVTYTSCTTVNEPVSNSVADDQGFLGLPWYEINSPSSLLQLPPPLTLLTVFFHHRCYTGDNDAGYNWAYCFPNGSPSCSFNGGYMRPDKGSMSSCTLACTNGYEGYTSLSRPTCNDGDQAALTMPSDPVSAGCTPVLCASYSPDLSTFEATAFSDSCDGSSNVLQAGSSCTLKCKAGLQMSGTGVVSCPLGAESGDTVNVDLSCVPINCAAFNLNALTEMTAAATNGCVHNQILTTASSSRCNIRCSNDLSETPFLYEVYCPESAASGGTSQPVVSGTISCSVEKCETYVYDPELEPADIGGCPEDAVTLSVDQSCALKCRDGYQATNESLRTENVQTLRCDTNQQYTSQPSCVRPQLFQKTTIISSIHSSHYHISRENHSNNSLFNLENVYKTRIHTTTFKHNSCPILVARFTFKSV